MLLRLKFNLLQKGGRHMYSPGYRSKSNTEKFIRQMRSIRNKQMPRISEKYKEPGNRLYTDIRAKQRAEAAKKAAEAVKSIRKK